MKPASVLFVCLGNICRSPTAQGVFEHKLAQQGLSHLIKTDSAGTSGWHIDEPPDFRTIKAAQNRGYELSHLRGRQFQRDDFDAFDYILVMDESNLTDVNALKPANYEGHLGLLLDFANNTSLREVPDPYHGGEKGFYVVLDLVEDACDGLLTHLKNVDKHAD